MCVVNFNFSVIFLVSCSNGGRQVLKDQSHVPSWANLNDFLYWAEKNFLQAGCVFGHGTDNAWDEAVMLAMSVLGLPYDLPEELRLRPLTIAESHLLAEIAIRRCSERLPLPYLTQQAWLGRHCFYVNENVLVPRSPIAEILAEQCSPWLTVQPGRVLDLCCGSGCLAILAAYAFPEAYVDACDICDKALEVAKHNLTLHGDTMGRVHLYHGDLFKALPASAIDNKYDLIISNPPYVPLDIMQGLSLEYQLEPRISLLAEEAGLKVAIDIMRQAKDYLTNDGILIMEVGLVQQEFEDFFAGLALTWIELAHGGEGIMCVEAKELHRYFNK